MTGDYDVLVMGGGLAGLGAALQLKQLRPKTRVACVEKREHPVPEAAFKVGESGAEIGCHYLTDVIGFDRHMEEQQMRKFSLRIFSTANGNDDIARRPEIGLHKPSPMRTYQIDRGRLENALAEAVAEAGVDLYDGYQLGSFELGPDRHTAVARRGEESRELTARWVIDATGRVGLLRRQLGLTVDIKHDVNASWFRLPYRLMLDEWSDDPVWRSRVPNGRRWMSTNQLVGEGYWVWLIPLPSGGHSVGLVSDARFVPFEETRRYSGLLDWLREHEPQLASHLPEDESGLQDFRKLKKYSYGTRRGLSGNRWCLTGEAGLFIDPLYSTGLDFIGVANTLATHLIVHALDGESGTEFRRRMKAYNAYYLGQFLAWEPTFAGQYEVFRDSQATAAKIIWDNASYFMFPALMFLNDVITDPEFVATVPARTDRINPLNIYMQSCLRELSAYDCDTRSAGFPVGTDEGLGGLWDMALTRFTKKELGEQMAYNQRRVEALCKGLLEPLYEACGKPMPPMPGGKPEHDHDGLIYWIPYGQRTRPPAEVEPQPAGGWMIR